MDFQGKEKIYPGFDRKTVLNTCSIRKGTQTKERASRMGKGSIIIEFWQFLRVRKKYWLVPIVFFLLLLGALIIISQGSALAPFIYTLF